MSNVTINSLVEAPEAPALDARSPEQYSRSEWQAKHNLLRGQDTIDLALPNIENIATKAFIERHRDQVPLGTGAAKAVYEHGDRHVLAVYRDAPSAEKMKEEFYKRKLAHLLLPKNIPDVHLAGSKPGLLIADRVHPKSLNPLTRPFKEALARVKLKRRLHKLGIMHDPSGNNLIYGQNGQSAYVDDPIYPLTEGIIKGIKKLPPESRSRALRYARRAFPGEEKRLEKLEAKIGAVAA